MAIENISELAALLAGIQPKQAAPMAIKQAAPPVAAPSMAAVMPKPQPPVMPAPAQPTLSTFVPSPIAPKPQPVMPNLAPTMGDPYRNNAVIARRTGLESNLADANKPLDQADYGPSIWQRIGAAMATFGAGMQHNPNAIGIGNDILNQNFTRAEYARQQKKKGAEDELEAFDRGEKQRRETQNDALNMQEFALRKSNQERQNRLTDAQIKDAESKIADREADNKKDPAAKAKGEIQLRREIADELGLKGADKIYYMANGKLKEPNPEAEARLAEARAAREQRAGDADERAENNAFMRHQTQLQTWGTNKARVDSQYREEWQKVQADFEKEFYGDETKGIAGVAELKDSDSRKKAVIDKYERKKQELQKASDTAYGDLGPSPKEPPILSGKQSAPSKSQPSSPAKVATRAQVEAFAKSKGMKTADVEKQLKSQGYEIK